MLPEVTATALVIHCSSHRVLRAFDDFVGETLKIADYDLISVPGGPQFLVALDYLPKLAWAGNRWTKFLLESHGLKRVVLIAHEDCGWYRQVHGSHAEIESRQRADLVHAQRQLEGLLPGVSVEAYFATFHDDPPHFERVRAASKGA